MLSVPRRTLASGTADLPLLVRTARRRVYGTPRNLGLACQPTYTAPMRWVAIVVLGVTLVMAGNASAGHPLQTGFLDPGAFSGYGADASVLRAHTAGASIARLFLVWGQAAPFSPADPEDPNDPAYHWQAIDRQVVDTVQGGLAPLVYIAGSAAGAWQACGITRNLALSREARAVCPGGCEALQRLLRPSRRQCSASTCSVLGGLERTERRERTLAAATERQPVSPAHYRLMVNAFADAVVGINPGNRVVAGTLGPFGHDSSDIQVVAPMKFMSDLLCVSMQAPHRKTCSQHTRFDIWAHNPYTNGGPTSTPIVLRTSRSVTFPRCARCLWLPKRGERSCRPDRQSSGLQSSVGTRTRPIPGESLRLSTRAGSPRHSSGCGPQAWMQSSGFGCKTTRCGRPLTSRASSP